MSKTNGLNPAPAETLVEAEVVAIAAEATSTAPPALNGDHPTEAAEQAAPLPTTPAPARPAPIPAPVVEPGAPPRGRGRSLKMQARFFRTLYFAAKLFARVLFWYYLMPKVIGQERVDVGATRRFVAYAREFRGFAIALGGVMIKLGQFVSTREDVLPEEITRELSGLQDEVPPVPNALIQREIARELGPVSSRYKWLAEQPIAAASLGQVYRGQLLSGERVVVKVQRPGIREIVYTDLAALRIVAAVANRFRFIRRRADASALVVEFGRVLLEEISYKREAQNAARFADIFKDDPGVYVPSIYAEHSTDSILTIEDVTTLKINDYAGLEAAGVSRKAVAKRLMDTYLKQVFQERFFHADPHPGNLFIYPLPHENGSRDYGPEGRPFYLIFVDFGMTGTLSPALASGLVNTLVAVVKRDPRGLVQSYQQLGFLMPDADSERIVEATTAAFNSVWGMNMTEIRNFGYGDARQLGAEFNDLISSMPFQVPQDFIYLGRAMGILSGMATSLDPDFNPWSELAPYAQKLVATTLRESGANQLDALGLSFVRSLFDGNAPKAFMELGRIFVNRTVHVPQQLENVLAKADSGDLVVRVSPTPTYRKQFQRLEGQERRSTRATLFSAFLVSSTLLYTSGSVTIGVVGYLIAGYLFLGLIFSGE